MEKPLQLAEIVLSHFELDKYFEYICGASLDFSFVEKCNIIEFILDKYNITDKASVLMVGDRKFDIIGAKQTGIASVGVLCGYGSKQELSDAGADYIVNNFSDISKIILE